MSTALLDIPAALEAQALAVLTPVVGAAHIAWPNLAFKPQADTPYARVDHLPARSTPAGVGVDSFTRRPGVLQVLLFHPLDKGTQQQREAVQAVCDGFKRGLRLTRGPTSVLIQAASPAPGFRDGAWWAQPVSISWLVYSLD